MSFGQITAARRRLRPLLAFALALASGFALVIMPGRASFPVAVADAEMVFAGAVCAAPRTEQPQPDGAVAAAHDCCLTCHSGVLASPPPGIELATASGLSDTVRLVPQVSPRSGNDGAWFSRGPPV